MKRKIQKVRSWYVFLLLSVIVYSCMNDDVKSPEARTSTVQFSTAKPTSDRGRSVDDVRYAIIGVAKSDGTPTYSYKALELYDFNGNLVSEEVELEVGDYSLTEFFLTDDEGNVLFLTPKEGSAYASSVDDPLPLNFKVEEDSIETIVPQVVAIEADPEDYGYVTFGFEVVETFEGKLYGIGQDSSGSYSFGFLSYDGQETIINELDLNGDDLNGITVGGFDYEGGLYYFDYVTDSMTSDKWAVLDVNGNLLLQLVTDDFALDSRLKYSERDGVFYGIGEKEGGGLFFGSMDLSGTETNISDIDSSYQVVAGRGVLVDSVNQYYAFQLADTDYERFFVVFDTKGNEISSFEVSQEGIMMNLAYSLSDQVFYGLSYDESQQVHSFGTLDMNGLSSIVDVYPGGLFYGINGHVDFDQTNELYIHATSNTSHENSVSFLNTSGEIVLSIDEGILMPWTLHIDN